MTTFQKIDKDTILRTTETRDELTREQLLNQRKVFSDEIANIDAALIELDKI